MEPLFDRSRTALIIIDMINDALKPDGAYTQLRESYVDQEQLISSNRRLLEAARAAQIPVIFTRTVRKPGEAIYLKHFVPLMGHRARTHGAEMFIEGTWGNQVIDDLKPLPTEHIINKKKRSAFFNTPLDLILRSMEITTLVVTGIGTPGCVESTVRYAFDLDYYIVIPRECTSTTNGREDRERTLVHLGNHCAIISSLDRVISALKNPAPMPLLELKAAGG